MGVNLFLLCVGLVICFGGIYFRKVVSGLLGFVWGAVLGGSCFIIYGHFARRSLVCYELSRR